MVQHKKFKIFLRGWGKNIVFRNIIAVFLVACLLSVNSAHLLFSAPGKTSSNQLKVDVGGRAVAMAGNQFGSEASPFAQFYNPAFLSKMSQKEVGFMHNEFLLDLRQDVLVYIHPTDSRGIFGGAINYFTYGSIPGYSASGAPTGDLSASDISLSGSWAKIWNFYLGNLKFENVSGGATLKILNKSLAGDSAFGFAVDFGFVMPIEFKKVKGLKVAGAIQNLSNGLKMDSETSQLPRVTRLGLAYSFWGDAINTMVDGVLVPGLDPYPAIGAEYRLLRMIAIRAGYKGTRHFEKEFSYGIGFENPLFALDYAFVPFGDLGDTHRISAQYRFGKNYKTPRADSQLREKVNEAKTLYAQGLLVDAYMISMQINHVAPWLDENTKLLSQIQRSFRELEESDKKEKLLIQINALFSRGERFFEEGNLINARADFQAVVGLQPDHAAALGYLKQIETQFQSFVENFYREGLAAFAAEDYETAKDAFEKVIVIKPDHEEARAQLAKSIEILEARKRQEQIVAQKEESAKIFQEGLVSYKKEQYDEAINLFNQVLEIDAENGEAKRYLTSSHDILYRQFLSRGQDNAAKGEWETAVKNLKAALTHNARSSEARGSLETVQRRWELQRKVLSQNLYKEGLEAFLSGDKKKAKTVWQRSIELDSNNEEAKRGLQRIGQ